jgi:DNA (cytosine-5)-methyltransferase 3A
MKVLSLFDGISCGMVALERAGVPVDRYVAYEIEPNAIKISKKNYPEIEHCGDVTLADFTQYKGFDLLIGGSPCQDLSIANQKGKGLYGERSGLFWVFVTALKIINPKYFLLENVASMKKKDIQTITEILGVQPIMINSSLVSAQQRKRLYWTNIPNVSQPDNKGLLLKDIIQDETAIPCALRTRKDYTGSYKRLEIKNDGKANSLTSVPTDSMCCKPIRLGHYNSGGQGDRVYSVYGKSVSLSANGGGRGAKTGLYRVDLPDGDYYVRKLSPVECERLQTLPDGYTEGVSATQRLKMLGNAWTVDVIAHILRGLK